jgi:chaperone BCS1
MIINIPICVLFLFSTTTATHADNQHHCNIGPQSPAPEVNFFSNFSSKISSIDVGDHTYALSTSIVTTFAIIFNGAIIGATAAVGRCCWGLLFRLMSASLIIHEGTPAFEWLLLMISSCESNHLRLNAKRSSSITTRFAGTDNQSISWYCCLQHPSSLLPQNSVCIGSSQLPSLPSCCRIFMSVSDSTSEGPNSSCRNGTEKEKITIVCTGSFNGMEHIKSLLKAARLSYGKLQREGTKLHIAIGDRGSFYWRNVGTRPARLLHSVICDGDIAQLAFADMQDFLESATWYADRGIPYRRGYLLYGEPGTGKSSLVMALAGTLKMPVYQVSLSEQALTDSTFSLLLNAVEPNSIVLLEDIDAAFCDRASREGSSLSFSGILNAIDGVAASEARILFMTTNHVEKLDPALIRPGRIDVKFKMTLATQPMIAQMFRHFYSQSSTAHPSTQYSGTSNVANSVETHPQQHLAPCNIHAMSEVFSQHVPSQHFSMASIQVYLMQHKRDPSAALAQASMHFQSSSL